MLVRHAAQKGDCPTFNGFPRLTGRSRYAQAAAPLIVSGPINGGRSVGIL